MTDVDVLNNVHKKHTTKDVLGFNLLERSSCLLKLSIIINTFLCVPSRRIKKTENVTKMTNLKPQLQQKRLTGKNAVLVSCNIVSHSVFALLLDMLDNVCDPVEITKP